MNKKDVMDILIKNALESSMEDISVPPMEDTWKRIEEQINRRKKKSFIHRKAMAAAVLLLIGVAVGSGINHEGYANYFRTMNIFTNISDQSIQIQMHNKTPGEMTGEPDLESGVKEIELEDIEMSIEDARDASSFQIQEPTYIPEGYPVEKVTLTNLGEKTIQVRIVYGQEEQHIELLQEPLLGEYAATININPKYGKVSEKRIHGLNYMIFEFVNGEIKIHWDRNGVKFTLNGNMEQEEMLKIASSVR